MTRVLWAYSITSDLAKEAFYGQSSLFFSRQLRRKKFYQIDTCGLYYKKIMIVNGTSIVIRMMLQVVVSHMIIILTTLEV
jgi:hypothetical protein